MFLKPIADIPSGRCSFMDMSDKSEGILTLVAAVLIAVVALMGMQEIALGLSVVFLCCLAAFKFLQANDEDKGTKKK
jgi:hypothetical protein